MIVIVNGIHVEGTPEEIRAFQEHGNISQTNKRSGFGVIKGLTIKDPSIEKISTN